MDWPPNPPRSHMVNPSRESLQALVEGCGITLDRAQFDQLWKYHNLLRSANAHLNLTRLHNFQTIVLKHYVDSLLVLTFLEPPSPLLDMGSGPGLPGIPIKIARPELEMILSEPRKARAEFLRIVCGALGLRNIEIVPRRVGTRLGLRVPGIISRAVATIPETLDMVATCLEPAGRMIFMKGPGCDPEIAQAARTHPDRFQLVADHAYSIPGTSHERRLVLYENLQAPRGRSSTQEFAGPLREVTSESNPTFRLGRDLLSGRGIRKHGHALIAGARLVAETLARFPDRVQAWLTDTAGPPPPADAPGGLMWMRLADPLFRDLDTFGTHSPMLLVRVPDIPAWSDEEPWPEGCTLFVPFQDPENVGAVIRSAAAFGVARVVLLREAAHPFHPKSARAAGTALFQVPLLQGPSIDELKTACAPMIALSPQGPEIGSTPFAPQFGLVAGLEGPGLPPQLRSGSICRIPIAPDVESLNAAAAVAVALYAWKQATGTAPER